MTVNRGDNLHQKTPEVTVLDNRGLTVRELRYHRHPNTPTTTDERITRHRFTLAGQLAHSIDPRLFDLQQTDNTVNPNMVYETALTGEVVRTRSVDAGSTLMLNDITGRPVLAINATEVTRTWQYEHETLPGRPLSITEQPAGEAARITERFVWTGNTQAEKNSNLAGQCVRHYDTAGLNQTDSIALNGVPLSVTRRLLPDGTDVDWQGDNEPAWNDRLAPESFTTLSTADATGALLTSTDAMGNVQRLAYDVAGLPTDSWLRLAGGTEQVIVKFLTYSAAGQKLREEHGNGVVTTYTYEPETQRLIGIKTERPQGHTQGAKVLQDLRYEYDPVGNVQCVTNDAEFTRFWRNQKVVPENTYSYDSLYQLVSATGREMGNIGQQGSNLPAVIVPLPADGSAYTNYTRTYSYDRGGNLTQMRHSAPATHNNYTTTLRVSDRSNRVVLSALTEDAAKVDGLFTAGGHQKNLLPGQVLTWTPRGELLKVVPVIREGASDDSERYRYDAASQRVMKVSTQKTANNTQTLQVVYLPGLELRTRTNGSTETENLQVIVVGETGRSEVRVLHWGKGKPAGIANNALRYSYDNLIGSSGLEVDGDGNIISLEEYYPYGGTAILAARNAVEADYKTVRYSGKELDATGLYYYGYRYYQPWAGRWLSADPAGTVDGLNLYRMARNSPVNFYDEQGTVSISIDEFNSMDKDTGGNHRNKKQENNRLYGNKKAPLKPDGKKGVVSSEHTILHSISANGLGRGDNIKTEEESLIQAVKHIENYGHAYQEYDDAHTSHVGSQNGRADYPIYYETQKTLLHDGNVSMVVQVNQIWYFSDSEDLAKLTRTNPQSQNTSDSFYRSVKEKGEYYFLKNNSSVEVVNVTEDNKIEMILSRLLGLLGRAPSNKEFGSLLTKQGISFPDHIFPHLGNTLLANKSIFDVQFTIEPKPETKSKNAKNKEKRKEKRDQAIAAGKPKR